jgi:hypothetical protein
MCPGIHYFKPAIMCWFEIMNTGIHYRWFERAKHIFEIMNTGTHYHWSERANHIFGIHCFKYA